MKSKLLILGLLAAVSGLWVSSLQIPSVAYQFSPINNQTDAARHAQYLVVRNTDDVAHEVGDVVVWKDSTNDGVDISTTTTAGDKLVAGVVALNDIPASSWGFIQTHGYHSGITVDVATAARDLLKASGTAEASTVDNTLAGGTFAVCLEATTSSTTVKGFLLR
jgi:hypothetical protein